MTNQIQETIAERGKQYGDFDSTAKLSQQLKAVLFSDDVAGAELASHQKESMEMICLKLARIRTGINPSYDDNWRDIAGYAVLGGKLNKPENTFKIYNKLNSKFEFGIECESFLNEKDLTSLIDQFKKSILNYFINKPIEHKGFNKYCISVEVNISPLNTKNITMSKVK